MSGFCCLASPMPTVAEAFHEAPNARLNPFWHVSDSYVTITCFSRSINSRRSSLRSIDLRIEFRCVLLSQSKYDLVERSLELTRRRKQLREATMPISTYVETRH